jgi:hypothetical protein
MAEMMVQNPELVKVLDKDQSSLSPEKVFVYYILYICAHTFQMRQRKVLRQRMVGLAAVDEELL